MRLLIFLLFLATPAFALDGSISTEIDAANGPGRFAADYQASIGQAIGDFRPYLSAEFTRPNEYFSNNNHNYRGGIEYNGISNVKLETGTGYYNGAPYGYGKITWSFGGSK
jgi:hypothetical protein